MTMAFSTRWIAREQLVLLVLIAGIPMGTASTIPERIPTLMNYLIPSTAVVPRAIPEIPDRRDPEAFVVLKVPPVSIAGILMEMASTIPKRIPTLTKLSIPSTAVVPRVIPELPDPRVLQGLPVQED
jgi:hypothetical protein